MNRSTKMNLLKVLIGASLYCASSLIVLSADEARDTPASAINAAYPVQSSERQFVYRSFPVGFLQGRGAKYVIAGRILNNQKCDFRRFDLNAVTELEITAHDDDLAKEALRQGKGDAISLKELPNYCEFLYYDAANNLMAYPLTATEEVLQVVALLAAVENNDCNWDSVSKKDISQYAAINARTKNIAGQKRSMLFGIYTANIENLFQAEDYGYSFGVAKGAQLKNNCKLIDEFAKQLKW